MANPVALKPTTDLQVSTQGVAQLTILPTSMAEVITFAEMMAKSNFVPAHLRGKPADCLAVCLQAFRWQADPFSVAQKTYFTREGSPPAYEAQLVNAIVYARAPLDGRLDIKWEGTWPNRVCVVTGHIKGDREPKVRRVQAAGITVRNSPLWKTDPDQQLAYYATRAWARLYTPDVLMGIYTPDYEDMRASTARDITPEDRPEGGKLDAMEAAIAGSDGTAPTDPVFGLPMEWPAPTADRKAWITAAAAAAKEIEALPDADAANNWESLNGDGLNQLMQSHRDVYDRLYEKLATKLGA